MYRHAGYFQQFEITNNAAMNNLVHVCFCFAGVAPSEVDLLGQKVILNRYGAIIYCQNPFQRCCTSSNQQCMRIPTISLVECVVILFFINLVGKK